MIWTQPSGDEVTVDSFYDAAIANNLAVAVWRAPGEAATQAVVDLSGFARSAPINFASDQPSFIVAPFVNADNQSALCIRGDVHLAPDGLRLYRENWNGQRQTLDRFLADCHSPSQASDHAWYPPADATYPGQSITQDDYERLVRSAIEFISTSSIEKIVVSRMTETPLPAAFDPVATFEHLCASYPRAFVSLVAIPAVGTWIGASPELLLSVDTEGLSTMALAGTQAAPLDDNLKYIRWADKEIEEQALVSSYIRTFFQDAGIDTVRETGPETVQAGNVVHLQTRFDVALPRPALQDLAGLMLTSLHPTSAVCGMPKDKALAFILANENYDRSFYSGFLGPVNISHQTRLYVNLRCMQLRNTSASLYVGGGITAVSNPQDEWRETQLKAETLLRVLRTTHDLPADSPSGMVPTHSQPATVTS